MRRDASRAMRVVHDAFSLADWTCTLLKRRRFYENFGRADRECRPGHISLSFHFGDRAYCPGWAAIRALLALPHGRLADSIRLNPLVLYMAVSIPSFLLYRFTAQGKRSRYGLRYG